MGDRVAKTLSKTQERLVPRYARRLEKPLRQVRTLAMADPVDKQAIGGISRRLVRGCGPDGEVVYAGKCRLYLPTAKSRRRLEEEDKSQISQKHGMAMSKTITFTTKL